MVRTGLSGPSEGAHDGSYAQLLLHHLDTATGRCAACGDASPCRAATEAAASLVRLGAWAQAPFVPRVSPPREEARLRRSRLRWSVGGVRAGRGIPGGSSGWRRSRAGGRGLAG